MLRGMLSEELFSAAGGTASSSTLLLGQTSHMGKRVCSHRSHPTSFSLDVVGAANASENAAREAYQGAVSLPKIF